MTMTFADLPARPGWKIGPEAADPRGRPPASPLDGMFVLFGLAPGDWEARLYLVPVRTLVEDLVEFFEVGSLAALRHGWDERDTIDLISRTLSDVEAIVPGTIEFVGPAALRYRFARKLRQDEVDAIEAVYHPHDDFQAGLEPYLNGWSGDSLLSELRETGLLQLRWD